MIFSEFLHLKFGLFFVVYRGKDKLFFSAHLHSKLYKTQYWLHGSKEESLLSLSLSLYIYIYIYIYILFSFLYLYYNSNEILWKNLHNTICKKRILHKQISREKFNKKKV